MYTWNVLFIFLLITSQFFFLWSGSNGSIFFENYRHVIFWICTIFSIFVIYRFRGINFETTRGVFYFCPWYGIFRKHKGMDFPSSTVGWTRTGGDKTNFHFIYSHTKGHWVCIFLVQHDLKSTVDTLDTFGKFQLDDIFFIFKTFQKLVENCTTHRSMRNKVLHMYQSNTVFIEREVNLFE